MTSDAKIGLLLGLLFIFIIAFLINGLPRFRSGENNNELTIDIVGSQDEALGIGDKEREVIRRRKQQGEKEVADEGPHGPIDNRDQFTIALPKLPLAVKESDEGKPAVHPAAPEKREAPRVTSSRPPLPRVYVVAAGDNLTIIAKKFYGSEEGNKIANINRIFQANRRALKSADEIYEGQEIVIPPLPGSYQSKAKTNEILPSTMFKKVKSIGNRHLSNDRAEAEESGQYVVREGDSLWRIAATELREGSRYTEIAKLNAGVLDDEDSLSVGMRLKMPARHSR